MIQGSEEWKLARCGKITASRLADLVAKTKSGYGASRKNYLAELLVERLTGEPTSGFTSAAMQWGTDHEPEARAVYEFETGNLVEEVGFISHPELGYSGASPDGVIGAEGMVEIKAPNTATHIETLLSGTVAKKYMIQMQWGMECAGRAWCDFVSFDPRMKDQELVFFCTRIKRDGVYLQELRQEVAAAETELQLLVERIRAIKAEPDQGEVNE